MGANGELGNARPCFNCLNIMKIVGIKKVYYSVKPDMIVCEKVKDMISIQASSVTKKIHREYYHAPTDDKTFFEDLLKKLFPTQIKKENLNFFLQHNFKFVLPTYKYSIFKNKNKVVFYDDKDCVICQSNII